MIIDRIYRYPLYFFVISFCFGCQPKTQDAGSPPDNGIVKNKRIEADKPPRDQELEYKNGRLIRSTVFFENGNKENENRFDPATNRWEFLEYYPSGKKRSQLIGNLDSAFTMNFWYESGAIQKEVIRSLGDREKAVGYFENGGKKEEAEFSNNKRDGLWAEWDSIGNQTRHEQYVDGVLKK